MGIKGALGLESDKKICRLAAQKAQKALKLVHASNPGKGVDKTPRN